VKIGMEPKRVRPPKEFKEEVSIDKLVTEDDGDDGEDEYEDDEFDDFDDDVDDNFDAAAVGVGVAIVGVGFRVKRSVNRSAPEA